MQTVLRKTATKTNSKVVAKKTSVKKPVKKGSYEAVIQGVKRAKNNPIEFVWE